MYYILNTLYSHVDIIYYNQLPNSDFNEPIKYCVVFQFSILASGPHDNLIRAETFNNSCRDKLKINYSVSTRPLA